MMTKFGGSAYAVGMIPSSMGIVEENAPPNPAASLRCVVVHPSGLTVPERLHQALRSKRITVEATDDIYGALVSLCRYSRDEGVSLPILVLVDPLHISEVASLVEAASVYAPQAVHWVYGANPREQIREIQDDDLAYWRMDQREIKPPSSGEESAVPSGSNMKEVAESVASEHPESQTKGQRGAILTDEELELLLADDELDELGDNDA